MSQVHKEHHYSIRVTWTGDLGVGYLTGKKYWPVGSSGVTARKAKGCQFTSTDQSAIWSS